MLCYMGNPSFISSTIVIISACVILYKFRFLKYWHFALLVGLFYAVIGCLFGRFSESYYAGTKIHSIGVFTGVLSGFIIGVSYATLLTDSLFKLGGKNTFRGYGVALGMAGGILFTTLIHWVLVLISGEWVLWFMMGDLPLGVILGAILGTMSNRMAQRIYKYEVEQNFRMF